MEMLKNKVEPTAKNNTVAEKSSVKFRVINGSLCESDPFAESISEGDIWESNLILGIGNDIY